MVINSTVVTSVVASATTSAIVGVLAAGFVNLQDASPGTAQSGHINISGNVRGGFIGANTQPTLARIQALEAGPLQGVRAQTNTGVAVFGKSTALTGLGAGGYFTSSSVGGRAVVGDAISGTGSNVGGLFYSRGDGGIGVQGIQRKATGTGTGVFGQAYSPTGAGIGASNVASGNKLVGASGTDSLKSSGTLPRHEYTATTTAAMVPLAYGLVGSSGDIFTVGTGNWTSARTSTGVYEVTITGVGLDFATDLIFCNPTNYSTPRSVVNDIVGGKMIVTAFNSAGSLDDTAFTFVIYRPAGNLTLAADSGLSPKGPRSGQSVASYRREVERSVARQREMTRTTSNWEPGYESEPRP